MPPQPGTLIEGKYEILTKIREGGMGTIYKVRHRLLDEVRVVKVMRPHLGADEDLRRRFAQEAKTATRLKHPNIVHILDFALDADGTAYIVMEFIDGVNLLDLLRVSGPPSVPLSLEIGRQTLQALSYLHRKSMVHRDIAPDNLMLTHDEDQRPLIKLIDLGIAKDLDRTVDMTSTGVFLGKVKYSSPEQLGGLAKGEKIDGRSDLYSLGVVLYELLTGEKPISGDTPRDLLAGHLFSPPRPFEETDPTGRVPEPVRQMLLRALEKPRERRFQTPTEFAAEIDRLQRQLAAAPDLDDTRHLLARARDTTPPLGESITPSAQDRLDRQFGAATTPPPTGPSGISEIENAPTVAATTATGTPRTAPPATVPPASHRRISAAETVRAPSPGVRVSRSPITRMTLFAVVLLAAGLAAFLLLRGDRELATAIAPTPAAPAPTAVPAAAVETTPDQAAAAEQTAPELPAPPGQLEATPPPVDAPPAPDEALRRAADTARANSDVARRRAERVAAPERASGLFSRGREREAAARRQLGRAELAAAAESFHEAERLYRQAEADARQAALAESVPTAAPAPTLVARVEPTRAPTSPPLPSPVPPTARPVAAIVPTPAPPQAASDEQKIRETLSTYRQSQNALDAAMYARVYPSLSAASRQRVEEAFRNLRSQSLDVDVQSIEITGATARARVFETRTAVPRIGSEQRDQRNRTIRLEKHGETWVIAGFE